MKYIQKIKLLLIALVLFACDDQELSTDTLSSIEKGSKLSGKIVNIESGDIDSVAIICQNGDWGGSYVLTRSAVSASGEFTMSLPIPSDLERIGEIFSGGFSGTISDELASLFQGVGSEITAYKNKVEVGTVVKCNYLNLNNSSNINAAMSGFIYCDREVYVKGIDSQYGVYYDFKMQKGWNELVKKKISNPDYSISLSNTVTSDLKWRFFEN